MSESLSKLEAVLFAVNEPVSTRRLAGILELPEEEVARLIAELKSAYATNAGGLDIFERENTYELVTRKEHSPLIEKILKTEIDEELTPASLEILAIVSYLGPVSRSSIEYVRGVNSSFSLRSLLLRGLIERVPHPERANAFLYSPTADILKRLGVSSIEELPEFTKYRELKKLIENEPAE